MTLDAITRVLQAHLLTLHALCSLQQLWFFHWIMPDPLLRQMLLILT